MLAVVLGSLLMNCALSAPSGETKFVHVDFAHATTLSLIACKNSNTFAGKISNRFSVTYHYRLLSACNKADSNSYGINPHVENVSDLVPKENSNRYNFFSTGTNVVPFSTYTAKSVFTHLTH